MRIDKLCKRYSKRFVLCESKILKDLECYGFKPTYDQNTGELIKETLWVEGGIYGDRPVMEMTNRDMEQDYKLERITTYNPLKAFVMNFHDWFYGDYDYHNRGHNVKLDIEIRKVDEINFNVILDLIEDGIIKREDKRK